MFLARAQLNRRRRGGVRLLTDPQKMHAAVLACFPGDDPGRVLWRIDSGRHTDTLYVVGPHQPDLTHVVEEAGWPQAHPFEARDYSPLLDRLESGMQVGYRITANPTYQSADTRKRYAHVTVAQQTRWLVDRLPGIGLDGPEPVITGREIVRFRHGKSTRPITLARATFTGNATVIDPGPLRSALVNGVGPAKGYGCGLLTLG